MIGVYTIRHPSSGLFYIGSTGNYHKRRYNHLAYLRLNKHPTKKLQDAYNANSEITWEIIPTTNREDAYRLERKMILENSNDPNIANVMMAQPRAESWCDAISQGHVGLQHNQETISKMSTTRTGATKTVEWSDKIADSVRVQISVDGTIYRSATEAAAAHGITVNTALYRTRNTGERFANWTFVK